MLKLQRISNAMILVFLAYEILNEIILINEFRQ